MKAILKISLCLLLTTLAFNRPVLGQTREKQNFNNFRMILERNIFDPERRAPQRDFKPSPRVEAAPPEQIRLIGVFMNEAESTIFFEGSQSSYNGEWKTGDMVAGLKIKKVQTNRVSLESKNRTLNLSIGSVLTKTDGEEWKIGDSAAYSPKTNETESTTKTDSNNGTSNDILKKLMERRKQETGQ